MNDGGHVFDVTPAFELSAHPQCRGQVGDL